MGRSMWSGTIGTGMLVLPVKLSNAVSGDGLELHRYRTSDGSRIRMNRVAEADGKDVAYADTSQGYELADGTVVLLTDDDFAKAFGEKSRTAKITQFVDEDALPRTAAGASYYVQPGKGGETAYALLNTAMNNTGKAAVVSIAIRQREAYALLYAQGDYLILERLHWGSDVKLPEFAAPAPVLDASLVALAENLVNEMSAPFDWRSVPDENEARLAAVVQAKAETGQVTGVPAPRAAAVPPADLAAALLASVEAARAAKDPGPVRTRAPRTAKKAAA